jgi:hypothetical protein
VADRLALGLTQRVRHLAEKLELQISIVDEERLEGVDWDSVQPDFGHDLRRVDVMPVLGESEDVFREEKCGDATLAAGQVAIGLHTPLAMV